MIIIISNKKSVVRITLGIVAIFFILFFAPEVAGKLYDTTPAANMNTNAYVAIVIDDFGNGSEGTKEMIALEIPFTGAVMPGLPNSVSEAESLNANKKEVILHMPMEAHSGKKSWLGPKALTTDLSTDDIMNVLQYSVENVPYISGINNHMGSKATEDERIMSEVFKICKDNDLYFLDSKTSGKSIAKELAGKFGVTVLERDVFLDGTDDVAKIEKNLQQAADIAKKRGWAIAIGHVGEEGGLATVRAIQNKYRELQEDGIVFVTISELKAIGIK